MKTEMKTKMKTPKEWEQQIAWSKIRFFIRQKCIEMKEKRKKLIEKAKKNKKKKE